MTPGQSPQTPANGDVDVLAGEVREAGVRIDVEIDVRVPCNEMADARQEPPRGERRQHADAEMPRILALGHLAHGIRDLIERAAHACREARAGIGQPDAATGALDETHAEVGLESLDLVTDRAVREIERLGGAAQALRARRGFEGAQCLHGRNVGGHRGLRM